MKGPVHTQQTGAIESPALMQNNCLACYVAMVLAQSLLCLVGARFLHRHTFVYLYAPCYFRFFWGQYLAPFTHPCRKYAVA
jgi:hypothetical protein